MTIQFEKIQTNLSKLKELRSRPAVITRDHIKTFRELSEDVQKDRKLSGLGREEQLDAVKKSIGQSFLTEAHKLNREYKTLAAQTKAAADSILDALPVKPDDAKVTKFNRKLNELKTDLLLSTNPRQATEKLQQFARDIDDPYFANQLVEQFATLAAPVIGAAPDADVAATKQALSTILKQTRSAALDDEQREVAQVYGDFIEGELERSLFHEANGLNQIKSEVGVSTAHAANDVPEEGDAE